MPLRHPDTTAIGRRRFERPAACLTIVQVNGMCSARCFNMLPSSGLDEMAR